MYTTRFVITSESVASSSPLGWVPVLALAFAIGTAIVLLPQRRLGWLRFAAIACVWWTAASVVRAVPAIDLSSWNRDLIAAYQRGDCPMAEGEVHVIARQRPEGHSTDRIRIGDVTLDVSHYEEGPQYHESIVFGGVLDEGVRARVWHCPSQDPYRSGGPGPIVRIDTEDAREAHGASAGKR